MNPKGNKRTLKASQPGNSNAQKNGLYSERERAKRARKVRQDLDNDPSTALENALRDRYSGLRAFSELLHEDLIEQGASDRHGKQRRQAGTYLRSITVLGDLEDQIRTGLAAAAIEDDDTQLWGPRAIKRRLQAIADDPNLPGGARVKALGDLLRENPPEEDLPYDSWDREFLTSLKNMTDEELHRELRALSVPISTGVNHEPEADTLLESIHEAILRLATQDRLTNQDALDLLEELVELVNED